jgi:uncharacterized membrane protein (UPF0127 family)
MTSIVAAYIFFLAVIASPLVARAEVHFKKNKLKLGSFLMDVEIAETPEQLERGLMYRASLSDHEGMLFIYQKEARLSFWMKNTFIPLSIGFFNANKELVDIQEMEPVTSEMQTHLPTYESRGAAQFALEVNKGWFQKHHIQLKTKFQIVK